MLGVGFDGLLDLKGQSQGGAGLLGRDHRRGAGLDGVEEGFDFETEGFAGDDHWFVHVQGRQGEGCGRLWFPRLRGETWGTRLCGSAGEVGSERVGT